MKTIHLNIGLNVNGVESLQMPHIAVALEQALPGIRLTECYIRQSSTERTACMILRWAGTYEAFEAGIYEACRLLKQDAIAGKFFHPFAPMQAFLIGPKAAEWGGAFNADYWLEPVPENDPVPACECELLLDRSERKAGAYVVAPCEGDSPFRWYFERQSDGAGGGLWFSLDNPDTGETDGFLHLIDYDGTFSLPRPVLVALRKAGVSVDSSYE